MGVVSEADTLDGVTAFSHFGTSYTWGNNYLGFLNIFGGQGVGTYDSALTLAGSGWYIQTVAYGSQGGSRLNAILTDADATTKATIDFLKASDGDLTIRLINSAIYVIQKFGSGDAKITLGAADTSVITLGSGNDTVTGGAGEIDHLNAGGGRNTITTGDGAVHSILTADGIDSVTIGDGGANSIKTKGGNDVVDMDKAFVDFVDLGDGNDSLVIGQHGGRFVALGAGDDTITLGAIPADFGILLDGDEGADTVNLSRFTQGVSVSLDQGGNFQDFGRPGAGYFLLHDMEDLIGTSKADNLTGSSAANRLTGGQGADLLVGLDGSDRLAGGKGNDVLTGGLAGDTFVFASGDGDDTVTDFALGQDLLSIAGATRLNQMAFATSGSDVLITFGNLHILVQHITVTDLRDVGNFLF